MTQDIGTGYEGTASPGYSPPPVPSLLSEQQDQHLPDYDEALLVGAVPPGLHPRYLPLTGLYHNVLVIFTRFQRTWE